MKFAFAIGFLLVLLSEARADDSIENCKCWINYVARRLDGKVQCHSVLSLATIPCNIPANPGCICEKDRVFSIMTDKDGMWCLGQGKKWPCENEDEWNEYEKECKVELYCIPNSHRSV